MKMHTLITFTLLMFSCYCYGQDITQFKRAPYKLIIPVSKGTVYEEDLKASPYVLPDNTVQLYPGETVYVEIEQENGVIKSMKAVREIVNPEKTLTIDLIQNVRKKNHESVMLKVKNPFKQRLIYEATMFLMKQNKWVKTNVYPVEPGLLGIEIWPDVIISMGLGKWSFEK